MEGQGKRLIGQQLVADAKLAAHAFTGISGLNVHIMGSLPLLHSQLDVIQVKSQKHTFPCNTDILSIGSNHMKLASQRHI